MLKWHLLGLAVCCPWHCSNRLESARNICQEFFPPQIDELLGQHRRESWWPDDPLSSVVRKPYQVSSLWFLFNPFCLLSGKLSFATWSPSCFGNVLAGAGIANHVKPSHLHHVIVIAAIIIIFFCFFIICIFICITVIILTQHCDAHGTLLSRREDKKSILRSCLRSNLLDAGYAGGASTPHITVEEASFYVWLYPPCHFRSSPRGLKWSSWEYAWACHLAIMSHTNHWSGRTNENRVYVSFWVIDRDN